MALLDLVSVVKCEAIHPAAPIAAVKLKKVAKIVAAKKIALAKHLILKKKLPIKKNTAERIEEASFGA